MAPIDFAPTMISLLGRTPPADMPGRPHPGIAGAEATVA
jgi:hypothetical protein